jgi:1,4-dihydroxy-2-naphthoyl-CoA hydrolase
MPLRADQTLDVLNARSVGRLPGFVGIRFTAIEDGMLQAELDVRPELVAPNGYLHAATVVALADTACGYGCLAHLPVGAVHFTTIELKSNFLGTAVDGAIACVARPAHLGNTTQVWDAVVTDKASAKTIALFRCTQLVIWPRK